MSAPETAPAEADWLMAELALETDAVSSDRELAKLFAAHRLAATPTALPSAEDAVGLVEVLGEHLFTLSAQLKASGFLDSAPHHAVYERVVKAFQALDAAALQSPRASDEVPYQCDACVNPGLLSGCQCFPKPASDEVLGEAGGADQARTIEILRRALAWHGDPQRMATTREEWQQEIDAAIAWVKTNPEEGRLSFPTWANLSASPVPVDASGQNAKPSLCTKCNRTISEHWDFPKLCDGFALSHTAPVADAQAGEGK